MANEGKKEDYKEITLKFGKGCVGEAFTAKDGKEYKQILIPNEDKDDHRPWASFVARASQVHENQYGKGMWMKLPAEGHTTIRRNVRMGTNVDGKGIWDTEKTSISNKDLKKMVEAYKTRSSIRDKLAEKQTEVDRMPHSPQGAKTKEAAL